MSGLCGFVGEADRAVIDRMLGAIAYRGDATDTAQGEGVALGYRFWRGRPGKSPGIHRAGSELSVCAGTLAPPVPSPAAALPDLLRPGGAGLAGVDGAFAAALWDAATQRLTLVRDPFGVRSLYYTEHAGVFYFASELKQLLAIPDLPVALSHAAVHKYLTFSFVPGEGVPIEGIRRLLPGHTATFQRGRLETAAYFTLQEKLDPALAEAPAAVRRLRQVATEAVARRLNGEARVGLYLSGGLDSSAVGVWLKQAGVEVEAFSLDFGEHSVEREQAAEVARRLEMPLSFVRADPEEVGRLLMDLVWKLDLPFGDAVTGPQYLLGRAAQQAGLSAVFNGEGGDQLFGGWTSKPMVAAAVYGDLYQDETPEEVYLRSYHRFYGLEDELYTPALRAAVGGPGQRRALLRPYLGGRADGQLPQPGAPGRHLAQGQPEHPAARRAAGQRLCPGPARAALRSGAGRAVVLAAPRAQAARRLREVRAQAGAQGTVAREHRVAAEVRHERARHRLAARSARARWPTSCWAPAPWPRGGCSSPPTSSGCGGARTARARPGGAGWASGCGRCRCWRPGCGSSSTAAAAARSRCHEVHPLPARQQVPGAQRAPLPEVQAPVRLRAPATGSPDRPGLPGGDRARVGGRQAALRPGKSPVRAAAPGAARV